MSYPYVRDVVLPAAMRLLPSEMNSVAARAMLLSIALQESRCTARRQLGGPARGFWQFEKGGGIKGVLTHKATKLHADASMSAMQYPATAEVAYAVVEHNDILAAIFARLLLWSSPKKLPVQGQHEYSWGYYLDTWRPGKPHRQTWDEFYDKAWLDAQITNP